MIDFNEYKQVKKEFSQRILKKLFMCRIYGIYIKDARKMFKKKAAGIKRKE